MPVLKREIIGLKSKIRSFRICHVSCVCRVCARRMPAKADILARSRVRVIKRMPRSGDWGSERVIPMWSLTCSFMAVAVYSEEDMSCVMAVFAKEIRHPKTNTTKNIAVRAIALERRIFFN